LACGVLAGFYDRRIKHYTVEVRLLKVLESRLTAVLFFVHQPKSEDLSENCTQRIVLLVGQFVAPSLGENRKGDAIQGRGDLTDAARPGKISLPWIFRPSILVRRWRSARKLFSFWPRWDVVLFKHAPKPCLNQTGDSFTRLMIRYVSGLLRELFRNSDSKGLALPFASRLGLNLRLLVWGRSIIEFFLFRHDQFGP
jgi:hypothetical protein